MKFVFSAPSRVASVQPTSVSWRRKLAKDDCYQPIKDCVCRHAGNRNAVGYTEQCQPDLWLLKRRAKPPPPPRSRCANIRQRRYDTVNTGTFRAKLLRLCLFTKSHEWLRPSGAAEIRHGQVRAGGGGVVVGSRILLRHQI